MTTPQSRSREVALPSVSLAALRATIAREAGPLAMIHALHAAGYQAGTSLFETFAGQLDGAAGELPEEAFWNRLTAFLRQRGWGSLAHASPHDGVGVLSSSDWAEADEAGEEEQPSCAFSSGMLSGLLTSAASAPVAVLQVACRSRGDDACTFAFGSEATVHDLYGLLLDGTEFEQALADL